MPTNLGFDSLHEVYVFNVKSMEWELCPLSMDVLVNGDSDKPVDLYLARGSISSELLNKVQPIHPNESESSKRRRISSNSDVASGLHLSVPTPSNWKGKGRATSLDLEPNSPPWASSTLFDRGVEQDEDEEDEDEDKDEDEDEELLYPTTVEEALAQAGERWVLPTKFYQFPSYVCEAAPGMIRFFKEFAPEDSQRKRGAVKQGIEACWPGLTAQSSHDSFNRNSALWLDASDEQKIRVIMAGPVGAIGKFPALANTLDISSDEGEVVVMQHRRAINPKKRRYSQRD